MDHEVFVDKTSVDPEMKMGYSKGGVGVLYKRIVGVENISSREKVWASTIKGDKLDMDEGNSSAVNVEAGERRGVSFLGDTGGIGKKGSVK